MRLKERVIRLEQSYDRSYGEYLKILTDEEFLAEFLRVLSVERMSFTVADVEHQITTTGGDLEFWRPLLDHILEKSTVISRGRENAIRYRYSPDTSAPHELA